jgi:hypothetical protein
VIEGRRFSAKLRAMLELLQAILGMLFGALRSRALILAENLALRQQLAI